MFNRLDKIDDVNIFPKLIPISSMDETELLLNNLELDNYDDIRYKVANYLIDFVKTNDDYYYLSMRRGRFNSAIFDFLGGSLIDQQYHHFYKCDQLDGLIKCILHTKNEIDILKNKKTH